MERNLAKHVGPEEFLQCSTSVIKENRLQTNQDNYINTSMLSNNTSLDVQDPKKTCNLESYLAWSARLRLLVANEILQVHFELEMEGTFEISFCLFYILKCPHSNDRNKKLELWCGAAQYCLLVGNYNSATTILEALDAPYISRLQVTVRKLLSMFHCRHCIIGWIGFC
jgi:RasGEF domain